MTIRRAISGALAALASLACGPAIGAAGEICVNLVCGPKTHRLSWPTVNNLLYRVEVSHDMLTWQDVGVLLPGTGAVVGHDFPTVEACAFYRILPMADPQNRGFLLLPREGQVVDAVDGVVFAFDLGVLDALPERVRIYQRVAGEENVTAGDWDLIGSIAELTERVDVRFVRGSVVWLPPSEGAYEILAEASGSGGEIVASAARRINVDSNRPPVVSIIGGPPASAAMSQPMIFTTDAVDPDGNLITRVEFRNHGVLVGTDWEAPFGDFILDTENSQYELLRGAHSITATAYDSRGGVSTESAPWLVEVTEGNSRPEVSLVSPLSGTFLAIGQPLEIHFEATDEDGPHDLEEVLVRNVQNIQQDRTDNVATGLITVETNGWKPGSHTLLVQAIDREGARSYPVHLVVYLSGGGTSFAEHLVQNITCGETLVVSNPHFQGAEQSSGIFTGGLASGLQMDRGALLTTGLFAHWNNGNTSGATGFAWGNPGDARLRDRVTDGSEYFTTHDAAALEFDVIPTTSQLEFEFQFGSEEYPEYTGRFNDGLLITVDDVIVSLVPDGSDIISVNSVNSLPGYDKHQHLYLDNALDIAPSVDPENIGQLVEYDGMSVKLRGHVLVEPGRSYRVRIVIADAIDDIYDSGIFIEEKSVRATKPVPCPNF